MTIEVQAIRAWKEAPIIFLKKRVLAFFLNFTSSGDHDKIRIRKEEPWRIYEVDYIRQTDPPSGSMVVRVVKNFENSW